MLKIFGQHDDKTVQQMWTCLGVGAVHKGVLCADGHYGYAQPVGGVVAYENQISVSGVGFDIGCGNIAVKLDLAYDDIKERVPAIASDISRKISFGLGRRNDERVEHALFDDHEAWRAADVAALKEMAVAQLGTVGSGNHYVDLFRDEDDFVWIGVHFGSRGLGHKSATRYLRLAGGRDGMDVPPAVIDDGSELGARYLAAMQLAGRYAYAGREWVVETIRRMLAAKVTDSVHNHHNFAWRERHGERDYWVVRRARRRPSRVSAASSAARWATTPSSSRASTASSHATRCTPRCTGPAASAAASRPRASATGRRVNGSARRASPARRWMNGSATRA